MSREALASQCPLRCRRRARSFRPSPRGLPVAEKTSQTRRTDGINPLRRVGRARQARRHAGRGSSRERRRDRGASDHGRDRHVVRLDRQSAELAGHPDPGLVLCRSGDGHHRRLPPPAHPSQLQVPSPHAGWVRGAGVSRGRGPGDRLGGDPPQAPPVLGRGRRSTQPARRTRLGVARRDPRARPRAHRLGVHRHGGRRRAAVRQGPAGRSVDPLRQRHVRALGDRRARRGVRARRRA